MKDTRATFTFRQHKKQTELAYSVPIRPKHRQAENPLYSTRALAHSSHKQITFLRHRHTIRAVGVCACRQHLQRTRRDRTNTTGQLHDIERRLDGERSPTVSKARSCCFATQLQVNLVRIPTIRTVNCQLQILKPRIEGCQSMRHSHFAVGPDVSCRELHIPSLRARSIEVRGRWKAHFPSYN